MSEHEKLQSMVDTIFKAPVGILTAEKVAARVVSYFGEEDYDESSIAHLGGGTIGAILTLAKLCKDLSFRVDELESRIANDGK